MLLLLEVFTVEETPFIVWFILGAFAAGSIPFGWLIAKANKVDLRSVGSGNIGGTNAWRALGWKWGLTVMLLDAAKGLIPVLLWLKWRENYYVLDCIIGGPEDIARRAREAMLGSLYPMLIGVAAILGHTFTPWLRFKGGKGVATGLGVAIALFQGWTFIPLAVFGITLKFSRMVSLSSILASLSLAVLSLCEPILVHLMLWTYLRLPFDLPGWLFSHSIQQFWPFAVLTALLVLFTHRENIVRIIAGNERRIGAKAD